MANSFFCFKQFRVDQDKTAMKVTTDGSLFGAWSASVLQELKASGSLLEIGCGTGLLSLMLAQKNSMQIDAVEIDAEAAKQARENVAASPWSERIRVVHQDIRIFEPGKKYDFIVSNPPFYENELASGDHGRNLAHHSKELSMDEVIRIIKNFLKKDGCFFLLLPAKRSEDVEEMINRKGLYVHQQVRVHQTDKHAVFRIMLMGSMVRPTEILQSDLHIRVEGSYSPEFTRYLQDYYLHL